MGMSAAIKEMMEADVTAAISDWSATLTYEEEPQVVGTFSPLGNGSDIEAEGILETADAEFVALRSAFSVVPPAHSVVDVDGTKFFVQNVTDDTAIVTLALRRN